MTFIAGQILAAAPSYGRNSKIDPPAIEYTYHSGTFAQTSVTVGATTIEAVGDAQPLAEVYADLLSKQERLGKEFEQVLFANLWDLYAR